MKVEGYKTNPDGEKVLYESIPRTPSIGLHNDLITQGDINRLCDAVVAHTQQWFLHPFRVEPKFVGEGRERDLVIEVIPMHRPYIACLL